jgi:C1A family cysteine protease
MYSMCHKAVIQETGETVGTGWLPPLPDLRDYSAGHPEIAMMAKGLGFASGPGGAPSLPEKVDLRQWCSPIESQGGLGSCSAHAGMGIVEYFEKRAFNKYIDGSRLFLYKTTRNLMGVTGDAGAWLRDVMGALALCGVPDEKYWPYTDKTPDFDKEPTAFVYSVADDYEAIKYFCHDPVGQNVKSSDVLDSVKKWLALGIPSMFGFFGFPSFGSTSVKGGIPYPCEDEQAQWGHAIDAVGYDNNFKITNTLNNKETTGALLIRNSWGTSWGDAGYGWLPYDYVLNRLAMDFWSLSSMHWIETKQFGI